MSLRNSCSESVVMSGRRSSVAFFAPALVSDALIVGLGGRIDLFDQLDLGLLQEGVELFDVGLVDVHFGQRGGDFR